MLLLVLPVPAFFFLSLITDISVRDKFRQTPGSDSISVDFIAMTMSDDSNEHIRNSVTCSHASGSADNNAGTVVEDVFFMWPSQTV